MPSTTRPPALPRTGLAHDQSTPPATRLAVDDPSANRGPAHAVRPGGARDTGSAVSSTVSGGSEPGPHARSVPSSRGEHSGNALVAVGPGLPRSSLLAGMDARVINPLPVQPVKIHCPLPRRDILSRERLNGWLDRAATGRVVLIVAEAGFGKTTLLADWAHHTGRQTAWYRLEPDDRDWLTFLRHLVASGRELDPNFGADTLALLLAIGPGGPTRQELVTSLAREMAEFGSRCELGLTLIFDDYHVVDGCPETDPIVRALLDRTGPGFSVVLSSRSAPRLPMGRFRARGGVDSLDGEDLCFDVDETGRLFRDAYRLPLQADVVADLCDRTEGWAALLTLVRTSLDENASPDPRVLIAQISASSGDLYEFLAEEVLAGLPPELQRFLMRVSVLTAVDVETAMLVDDRPAEEVAATIRHCENLGLLTRPDRESPHRFHPLVREFLVTRLQAEVGIPALQSLHRSIGKQLAMTNWQASAWHFVQGGDKDAAAATVDGAAETIIASGAFQQVVPFLDSTAGDPERPAALVLRSRAELERGNRSKAASLARRATAAAEAGPSEGIALLNLASILSVGGFDDEAVGAAKRALEHPLSPQQRYVAQATVTVGEASREGDLEAISDGLMDLARQQDSQGLLRYAGVSRLNLAATLLWLGEAAHALREAERAEVALGGRNNKSVERAAATATRAIALAQLGRLAEAVDVLADSSSLSPLAREEMSLESARLHSDFGAIESAETALGQVEADRLSGGYRGVWSLVRGVMAMRRHDVSTAAEMCDRLAAQQSPDAAGKLRAQLLRTRVAMAQHREDSVEQAQELERIAAAQNCRPGRYLGAILRRIAEGQGVGDEIERVGTSDAFCFSLIAEELASGLEQLSPSARNRVLAEARLRPERWRTAFLAEVIAGTPSASKCADALAEIGSEHDASILRYLSRSKKNLRPPALAITKRLAPQIFIADLGPVDVVIRDRSVRRGMRRKVLALLCYLSSRPEMAATKDEALEALWPDLNPYTGANSLHQTIYSLRRVFEPEYREGLNAGYIEFDGDVVGLDPRLVDSSSRRCWRSLGMLGKGSIGEFDSLLSLYTGRYALDFAYEDWASTYRENLHAAVLAAGEAAITTARRDQNYELIIAIGHALLTIDPQADAIELELLRAYKASGRHAAAAEQYAHYAAYLRVEMAVDVPSLEDL
jgi:DNA-binding SARP family transcriptional activator